MLVRHTQQSHSEALPYQVDQYEFFLAIDFHPYCYRRRRAEGPAYRSGPALRYLTGGGTRRAVADALLAWA
jgi:hypothetical protein